jgi:hypothetical protein
VPSAPATTTQQPQQQNGSTRLDDKLPWAVQAWKLQKEAQQVGAVLFCWALQFKAVSSLRAVSIKLGLVIFEYKDC